MSEGADGVSLLSLKSTFQSCLLSSVPAGTRQAASAVAAATSCQVKAPSSWLTSRVQL